MNPWEIDWQKQEKQPWEQDWNKSAYQSKQTSEPRRVNPILDERGIPQVPIFDDEIASQPAPAAPPRSMTDRLFGYSESTGTGTVERKVLPGAEPLRWAEQNPEVVGSTIATFAAPELPVTYMLAQKLGPYLAPAYRQLLQIPAAFMGGATGSVARQVNPGTRDPKAEISDVLLDSLKSGAEMAGVQAAGTGTLAMLTKAFAPGLTGLSNEAQNLMQFAKDKKLPAPPSVFTPSLTAKATEGVTDAFMPSRLVNDHYRKKMVQGFNRLMTEIPEEVGTLQGNSVVSQKALTEIKSFLGASQSVGKELATEFVDEIGAQTRVPVSNTKAILAKIERTATDEALRNWAATKSAQIKGKVTAEELETALRQVGGIKPKGDKNFLDQIRNAIKADFEAAGAPMEKLAESNKAFQENYALMSKKFARELAEESARGGDGTGLTVKLFRTGNENFLRTLGAETQKEGGKISKETWDSLRAQNLQNMITNASVENKKIMGLKTIDGFKLEKILDANKKALDVAYADSPDTIHAMYNLARLAKATAGQSQKFEQGMSETLKLGNMSMPAISYAANNIPTLIIGSVTAPLLAKSLMNPNGWAKEWLTTGFRGGAKNINQGLMLGGRLAVGGNGED